MPTKIVSLTLLIGLGACAPARTDPSMSPAPGTATPAGDVSAARPATPSTTTSGLEPLGARALPEDLTQPVSPQQTSSALSPSAYAAANDTMMLGSGCHAQMPESEVLRCVRHDGGGEKVLLAGDSHAGQWMEAFDAAARQRNWHLEMATKSSCPLIQIELSDYTGMPYESCRIWVSQLMAEVTGAKRPDVLVVSHSNYLQFVRGGGSPAQRANALVKAEIATLAKVQQAGVRVVVLRDTPQFAVPVPRCVVGNPRHYEHCAVPLAAADVRRDGGQPKVASELGAPLVDLTPVLCPGRTCPAVIGDVLVWRDTNHLTGTYVRSAADRVARLLAGV